MLKEPKNNNISENNNKMTYGILFQWQLESYTKGRL